MSDLDLDRFRQSRQRRSIRMVAIARLGVVAIMVMAMQVGVTPRWKGDFALVLAYGLVATCGAALVLARTSGWVATARLHFALTVTDVVVLTSYKLVTPAGAYVPLVVMLLLPTMVVLDMSARRAAAALLTMAVAFAITIYYNGDYVDPLGWGRPTLMVVVFLFICVVAWVSVFTNERQIDEIAHLSAIREALLIDTMTASDLQQRKVSEFIHDGPLQTVLMARQDIVSVLKTGADARLDRALAGLVDATAQMREATFELHPAVLAGAGLANAIRQLADTTGDRSGIDIRTEIDDRGPDGADPVVFAVVRELLSNVVRHSNATVALVKLTTDDGRYRLDVTDDGVGLSPGRAQRRLTEGHIGLASQRARIEGAGGTMNVVESAVGTHIAVVVPRIG